MHLSSIPSCGCAFSHAMSAVTQSITIHALCADLKQCKGRLPPGGGCCCETELGAAHKESSETTLKGPLSVPFSLLLFPRYSHC